MARIVPDTNVILSAIFWKGNSYEVIRRGLIGEYRLITSSEIIEEVRQKLRVKFRFPEEKIEQQTQLMLRVFEVLEPRRVVEVARDKNDNKILGCAADAHAEFIVTGDNDLLVLKKFESIQIVTPAQFLAHVGP